MLSLVIVFLCNVAVERARVVFSYVAENEDELTLNVGDTITILHKKLEDAGWWKGELRGKIGVFPDNFVELLPPDNKPVVVSHQQWINRLLSL